MSTRAVKAKKAQKFVAELCDIVKTRFPEAEFNVLEGADTGDIHIYAYADIDSVWDMLPLVSDRTLDILLAEGISIYVIPMKKGTRADRLINDQADVSV